MLITWDEPKRLANRDKHGLDFAALSYDFSLGPLSRLPDKADTWR
jgi:uncharacterized DUF497 family protein